MRPSKKLLNLTRIVGKICLGAASVGMLFAGVSAYSTSYLQATPTYTVFAYNDLGMHCMGSDFSEICILPPANTMRATVIRRGAEPEIIDENLNISYAILGNTSSHTKTNFWSFEDKLFGVSLPDSVGLFGNGLTGIFQRTTDKDWIVEGVPITPIQDNGVLNAYQLAQVTVKWGSTIVATTEAVMPVSWEMHCDYCHRTAGMTVETDILRKHDRMHGTTLEQQKPVLCAKCHADAALGANGVPNVSTLSRAMHRSHANRFDKLAKDPSKIRVSEGGSVVAGGLAGSFSVTSMRPPKLENKCYACHPGTETQCLRDMHESKGEACNNCHGDMMSVASLNRRPWIDEPKCSSCHNEPGHDYEEPGKLYRNSRGHGGVKCEACHGSPHAIFPTRVHNDNIQSITKQGHAGKIDTCSVCHTSQPNEAFFHSIEH